VEHMSSFGERLQYLMDINKITQKEVAEKLGFNKSQVSKWISVTTRVPRRENLHKFSSFFRCDIEWLATGAGEPFPPSKTETAKDKTFVDRRRKDIADDTLSQIRRERFKMQCSGYFDELFDFVGDCYGEDQEAVNDFLAQVLATNPKFCRWQEEKKERTERDRGGFPKDKSVNDEK